MCKNSRVLTRLIFISLIASSLLISYQPAAEAVNRQAPRSLKTVQRPLMGRFDRFIRNEQAAIALGKALFWDMQVGSDGIQACASCHFHAGADSRIKNQINPGSVSLGFTSFDFGGPNYKLRPGDFPFPKERDEVVSSAGVFSTLFNDIILGSDVEDGTLVPDIFNVGGINTRRVEPRNSPTVINAIFNHRNFWDGRASEVFNGDDVFGDSNTNAKVYRVLPDTGKVRAVSVSLPLSSVSSQVVGPPLSHFEMSYDGRTFYKLGKKMLELRPLAKQQVHKQDSVLGRYSRYPQPGLNTNYHKMIKAAFQPEWWDSPMIVTVRPDGTERVTPRPNRPLTTDEYTIMEANFSLIMGLAVRFYEATLVSDDTPFDRFQEGDNNALTQIQQDGLDVFLNKGKCINCHGGPEFTNASVTNVLEHDPTNPTPHSKERISRMIMGDGGIAVYDEGFYNIGVRATAEDIGIGGTDPFGRPLSFSRRALLGDNVRFDVYPPVDPAFPERVAVDGAFKTPTIRNVELTGPYFHNGGKATLEEVVEHYDKGALGSMGFAQENIDNLDPDIVPLGLTEYEKQALVAFMKALTDERVRFRKAPFDHPQLFVPNGHHGDELTVFDDGTGKATEELMEIPAVGRLGGPPLKPFHEILEQ